MASVFIGLNGSQNDPQASASQLRPVLLNVQVLACPESISLITLFLSFISPRVLGFFFIFYYATVLKSM